MKNQLFVPYSGKKPAALSINGHKLLILTRERDELESSLALVGGDRVKALKVSGDKDAQEFALDRLAQTIQGGVVVTPTDVGIEDVIRNLEVQLPWIQ